MTRTDVTYGQLDKVLRSLRFSCRPGASDPTVRLYEHKETGALLMLPSFAEDEFVLDYHLILARTTLDEFGIADPSVFARKLQKAG
jgi:hypothetical protein